MDQTTETGLHYTSTPDWVSEAVAPENPAIPDKDLSDGVLFILSENQINFSTEEYFNRIILKITSSAGLQNNTKIIIEYSPLFESVSIHRAVIKRGNEVLDFLAQDKLKVVIQDRENNSATYSGIKTIHMHFEDARVGDILEYSYTVKGRNPIYPKQLFCQSILGFSVPLALMHHRLVAPKERSLNTKFYGTTEDFTQTQTETETIYELFIPNCSKTIYEDLIPSWYEPFPYYCVSEFNSWEEISAWASSLFPVNEESVSGIAETLGSFGFKSLPKEQAVKSALQFVQNEVRYLADLSGIYGYKPHSPQQVMQKRFGDCKDKSLLLCVILKYLGIKASPALVNTYLLDHIKDRIPTPFAFNHCVVRMTLDGEHYWFDPTIFGQGGDLGNIFFPDYKTALLLDEENPGLVDIQLRTFSFIKTEDHYKVTRVNEPVELSACTRYEGGMADNQRTFFMKQSLSEIESRYIEFYKQIFGDISSGPHINIEDDPVQNIFIVHENYTLKDPWKKVEGNSKVKKISFTFHSIRNVLPFPAVKDRKMPISMPGDVKIEHRINIDFNQSMREEKINNSLNQFGINHRVDVHVSDNNLTGVSHLTTNMNHIPASDTQEYLKFFQQLSTNIDYELSLSVGQVDSQVSNKTKWYTYALFIFIFFAMINIMRGCNDSGNPYEKSKYIRMLTTNQNEVSNFSIDQ